MAHRKLRAFEPRSPAKADTGVRISKPTLAMIEEVRSFLLQELWANAHLRPEGWDGKLSQDSALRLILMGFADAYGCPLNTDERWETCGESD